MDRYNHDPNGYKEMKCQLIFDIKMDITRKVWYVAGGNLNNPPSFMTYVSMVSRDIVHLALLIVALNYFYILSGDIQNSYLNAPTKEKLSLYAVDEWKYDLVKLMLLLELSVA